MMHTESTNGKLFERIAAVMNEVRKLPQDGYNNHDKYAYTTAATAIEAIGKSMAKNGLVVIPIIEHEVTEKPDGSKAYHSTVELDFNLCDIEGNSFMSRWVGQGVNYRTPDKALKTALTNAETTFLLKLFLVGAGEDDPGLDSQVEPRQIKPAAVTPNAGKDFAIDPHNPITDSQRKRLHKLGNDLYGKQWEKKRPELVSFITGGQETSSTKLTETQAKELISGLQAKVNEALEAIEAPSEQDAWGE